MNFIKNFFHAFGDIIFGLVVVGIAVFLIGTQINNDFDVFALGAKAYDSVVANINGEKNQEPSEILAEPDANSQSAPNDDIAKPDDESKPENDEGTTPPSEAQKDTTTENTPNVQGEDTPLDSTKKIIPPDVPDIRNVQISSGATAEEVASGLFSNGIIPSKEDFLLEYAKLPTNRTITSGKFQIPTGSTATEILSIIAP